MHPSIHAILRPDAIAAVFEPSGAVLRYRDLEARSNQIAHLLRREGLKRGDVVALVLENEPAYFEVAWAAQRAGLYYVCLPTRLTPSEFEYILRDSGAKVAFVSPVLTDYVIEAAAAMPGLALWSTGLARGRAASLSAAIAELPSERLEDESAGSDLLYSSGTTGRPKGVKPPLSGLPLDADNRQTAMGRDLYGMDQSTIYLCPAPLYHAAPLRWCMAVMKFGGVVIVMDKFDAESALQLIAKHAVTHAQWVPTHFIRMLKLPNDVRDRYDLGSLRVAFHAAAPCPVPVKEAMIDWWGPIIHEYYSGTEAFGLTAISPEEWLTHKGSVGRAIIGKIRICDANDDMVPARCEGLVYFADGPDISYHNAPEKDAEATNSRGWRTFGDVGWVDEDGYLYLTDRRSFMIVSGGVNIYPQEAENILATHPMVADVAVIGVPNEDMGEEVKAVVQLSDPSQATPALGTELIAYVRDRLSAVKAPRSVDFVSELPRQATGKLHKRLLRDRYWSK